MLLFRLSFLKLPDAKRYQPDSAPRRSSLDLGTFAFFDLRPPLAGLPSLGLNSGVLGITQRVLNVHGSDLQSLLAARL
jgi:hypothetical protein